MGIFFEVFLYSLLFIFFVMQFFCELQLSGYAYYYPYLYSLRITKKKYLYVFLVVGVSLFSILFCVKVYIFYISIFVIEFLIALTIFDNLKSIKKIKFTSRMKRIIFVEFVVFVSLCFLLKLIIGNIFLLLLNLFLFILIPISLFFTLVILYPLERLIGFYYISKAERTLRDSSILKIGITGSFGKTSVKEILLSILRRQYNVLATPKSFNTPFGISKTINENFTSLDEIFICEMGAKRVGEILQLCKMIDVDCGIVTSVGRQHTKTFGSIENIYKTKFELPKYLNDKPCVFNLMNSYTKRMFNEYPSSIGVYLSLKHNFKSKKILKNFWRYSPNKMIATNRVYYEFPRTNVFSARNICVNHAYSGFDVYANSKFLFRSKIYLIGLHNIINSLLAIAMAVVLDVNLKNIELGLCDLKRIDSRCDVRESINGGVIINNGYNSNIDSVGFLLKTIDLFDKKNKVIVTPGLIESLDDYYYNFLFAQKISAVATSIVIVKDKNKRALLDGLNSVKYDMSRVRCVSSFNDVKDEINNCSSDWVYLIENDLPDNYQ